MCGIVELVCGGNYSDLFLLCIKYTPVVLLCQLLVVTMVVSSCNSSYYNYYPKNTNYHTTIIRTTITTNYVPYS